jgi:hypothetical protein
MTPKETYEDAGRAQRVKTVLGEIVEDVVRIKNETTHTLDRVIQLEGSMRMLMRVAEKMGTPAEDGPPDGKTREEGGL